MTDNRLLRLRLPWSQCQLRVLWLRLRRIPSPPEWPSVKCAMLFVPSASVCGGPSLLLTQVCHLLIFAVFASKSLRRFFVTDWGKPSCVWRMSLNGRGFTIKASVLERIVTCVVWNRKIMSLNCTSFLTLSEFWLQSASQASRLWLVALIWPPRNSMSCIWRSSVQRSLYSFEELLSASLVKMEPALTAFAFFSHQLVDCRIYQVSAICKGAKQVAATVSVRLVPDWEGEPTRPETGGTWWDGTHGMAGVPTLVYGKSTIISAFLVCN